jgi:magnesium-transporting ATPase (P-type)
MLLYIGNIIFGTVYIARCLTNIMLHMLTAQTMATVNYFLIRWNNTNIFSDLCEDLCFRYFVVLIIFNCLYIIYLKKKKNLWGLSWPDVVSSNPDQEYVYG